MTSAGAEVISVSRSFGRKLALDDVNLRVATGEVHALLGPNGAGKTTLLRILIGLTAPSAGNVRILGLDPVRQARVVRERIGVVPSGDRSFYLRLSGLENLSFFGRLQGLRRRDAFARARVVLDEVGLLDAAKLRVGLYSHGMQKRLSVGRALLNDPQALLVDEATHDLDPEGARQVQRLVRATADRGRAVLWTTQRVDEIRGFADRVTLLGQGRVCFAGTVPELMTHATPRRYLLRLRNGATSGPVAREAAHRALDGMGTIAPIDETDPEHCLLSLRQDAVLGDAVAALAAARIQVLACREERSEIEEAFLALTGAES